MAQTYNSSAIYTSSFGKESIRRITSADINNDGSQDIVFSEGKFVTVLLNDKGSFTKSIQIETSFDRVGEIVSGDFNRDGQIDITYSSFGGVDGIEISFLKDNGVWEGLRQKINLGNSGTGITDLTVSDLNNDGYLEIVSGGNPVVLENRAGTFYLGQILWNTVRNAAFTGQSFASGLMSPLSLTTLDINKDLIRQKTPQAVLAS
jgi:FG-GAP-like repeat